MENLAVDRPIWAIVEDMDEIPPEVPGYRLTRLLGHGASAGVWRARRLDDDELVAVKVLPGVADEEAVREYALLQHAASEHVVTLHETLALDVDGGTATALVLELLAGGSLARVVAERGHLAAGETVTVIAPVAQALAGLHDLGIVHGDLSPGNVLLDSTGRPSVADLGHARLTGERPGDVHGTDGYVAPEVLEGGEPTRASDVYALGALAWACLVGTPPGHVAARPDLADVTDAATVLTDVVEQCLSTDPQERPEADEVARAVFDAVEAEPLRMTSPGDVASGLTRRIREAAAEEHALPSWQRELAAQAHGTVPRRRRWWRLRRRKRVTLETGEDGPTSRSDEDEGSRRRLRDRRSRPRGRHGAPGWHQGRHAAARRGADGSEVRAGRRWRGSGNHRWGGLAGRRWAGPLAALAAVALALLIPWQQLATAEGDGDPSSTRTSTRSAANPEPTGAAVLGDRSAVRTSPRKLATALTDLRQHVVVHLDVDALAHLVEPDSPADDRSSRLLEHLRSSGDRYRGVDLDVRDARLRSSSGTNAVLRTTVDEGAYVVRHRDGNREERAARTGHTVDLVLVWQDGSWRVRDVRATSDGSGSHAPRGR